MNDTSERIISEIEKLDISALSPKDVKDACIEIAKKVNKRVLIDNRYHPCFCGNNRRKNYPIYNEQNRWVGRSIVCTKCGFSVSSYWKDGDYLEGTMKKKWNMAVPSVKYEDK